MTASDLLSLWECCRGQAPGYQALALLSGCAGVAPESAKSLSVGARDRALIAARKNLFGPRLDSCINCPECDALLELTQDLDELATEEPKFSQGTIQSGSVRVQWRLPTAGDMAEITRSTSVVAARYELIRRCLVSIAVDGRMHDPDEWPDEILAVVEREIRQADPASDLTLALVCPGCRHRWEATFDVVSLLWAELNELCERLLSDVHRLATAYGWRESDILTMSAMRRAVYLEMCSS